MSPISTRSRALAVGVLCAAGGVGAGAVATATASTGSTHQTKTAHHARAHGRRDHGLRGLDRRAVQGSVVVHTKDGFKTITFERGVVDSVSGDRLTLTEGGAKHAYKQVTVTVPANARIRDNGKKSSLSSVSAGQRVLVAQMPKHMVVRAHTPKHHTAS